MHESPRTSWSAATRPSPRGLVVVLFAAVILALCPAAVAEAKGAPRVGPVSLAGHRHQGQIAVKWHKVGAKKYQLRWAVSASGLSRARLHVSRHPRRTSLGTTRASAVYVQVRAVRGGAAGPWSAARRLAVRRAAQAVSVRGSSFSDEFSGGALNTSNWTREGGSSYGIETFRADSDLVSLDGDGHVVVSAKKNADGSWRGGMISTRNIFAMRSGTVEIRAKLPTAQGAWPAMWMINNLYGQLHSEIDIMELFPGGGVNGPGAYFTIHDWTQSPQWATNLRPSTSAADGGWHTWKMVWTASSLQLYIDGVSQGRLDTSTISRWVWKDAPLYLVFDMAVAGSWSGALRPAPGVDRLDMSIDYIRVNKTA
jgi:beta-glucanase (GH16 family)